MQAGVELVSPSEEVMDTEENVEEELGVLEDQRSVILHLLSQLKLGMDLTRVVLPTFILEKRSLLEMYANFMAHPDMFLAVSMGATPEERMVRFVEYYLTAFHEGRKGAVAKKPYNPILGETFHCSWEVPRDSVRPLRAHTHSVGPGDSQEAAEAGSGSYRVRFVAEQVSHHPPVSAFYCECRERGMCVNVHVWTKSKFMGMSVGVSMVGEDGPTGCPTDAPVAGPADGPTGCPTDAPVAGPADGPTGCPTDAPVAGPADGPTGCPTDAPVAGPADGPTGCPTDAPVAGPADGPTGCPTDAPVAGPADGPTGCPTDAPVAGPADGPTGCPTDAPVAGPADGPTGCPTDAPVAGPTLYVCVLYVCMSVTLRLHCPVSCTPAGVLSLLEHGEEYVFTLPSAYARSILTVPWVELGGKVTINCAKSGYSATVTFHTKPFYGGKVHRVTAEVKQNSSGTIVCKAQGEWNGTLEFSYSSADTKVFDTTKLPVIKKLIRPEEKQGRTESR
ncbi:hypothetical protein NFI96_031975 [Prochilodus magdalenae]|nr:hypothetical protein NFI96_031975 [Prochilodus magdalenae]